MTLSDDDKVKRYLRITATRARDIANGRANQVIEDMVHGTSFRGNDWTEHGHLLEPIAVHFAQKRLGHPLLHAGTTMSQTLVDPATGWHWAAASGDRYFYTPSGQMVNVECKGVNWRKIADEKWGTKTVRGEAWDYKKSWQDQVGSPDEVAEEYHAQLDWQHIVLNCAGSIVVTTCGTETYLFRFPRRHEKEKELIDKCYEVWKTAWALRKQAEEEKNNV